MENLFSMLLRMSRMPHELQGILLEWRTKLWDRQFPQVLCTCAPFALFLVCIQSVDTMDNGKPFKDALTDVRNAARTARYFAGMADKAVGQTIPIGAVLFLFQLSFLLMHSFGSVMLVQCACVHVCALLCLHLPI